VLLSRSCGARERLARPDRGPPRPRRVIESLVKPPRISTLYSSSPSPSLCPPLSRSSRFFPPSALFPSVPPLLRSIPSTSSLSLSLSLSLSYSSYFTITISGSSRSFPLSALPALLFGVSLFLSLSLSFIKYIYLTYERTNARTHARTHACMHACLIIMRTYEIVSAGPASLPLRLLHTNIYVASR